MSWNGKVRCIKDDTGNFFTVNKIYEVTNGTILNNYGRNESFENVDNFNSMSVATFEEVKTPVLCEILNVELNEKFKLTESNYTLDNLYWVDESGNFRCDSKYNEFPAHMVVDILKGEYTIVKLPFYQLTEDEITILSGLYLNDYEYIARDKDNDLWAYQLEPLEDESGEYDADDGDYIAKLNNEFFKQVQWGNILDIKAELDRLN